MHAQIPYTQGLTTWDTGSVSKTRILLEEQMTFSACLFEKLPLFL